MAIPTVAVADLNVLSWCNHADDVFIDPFEQANDVEVNVAEVDDESSALAMLEASEPGNYDVLVTDGTDIPGLVAAGLLAELPADELPIDDLWPEVARNDENIVDGKRFGVTELFGYNAVVYNKARVEPDDMRGMSNLWNGRFAGRVAVYDWALPVIGLVGLGIGADDLGMDDMPAIRETLGALEGSAAMLSGVADSQEALVSGEVDIVFGGGEWLTAALSQEMPELDWTLPSEGGLLWTMSAGQVANSRQPALALKFIQHIMSPAGQAALATSSCYWALPANKAAGTLLDDQQRRILRWADQPDFLARAQPFPDPNDQLDKAMEEAWNKMRQRRKED